MEEYTIAHEYTLPSKGLVYSESVNPNVKLRSMTTEDEMKRLGHSDRPYKLISEIIDSCLIEKPGISSYDMCLGDYQYLLYRLRAVTYGPDYNVNTICPICGNKNETTVDLDSLEVISYNEDIAKHLNIELPVSHKNIKLKMQTPRMLDDISLKGPSNADNGFAFLFTLMSMIEKVDGEYLDEVKLESFVRHLPARDSNYIIKSIEKLNIGINNKINCKCGKCHSDYSTLFPITGEFFGPSID